MKKQLTFLVLLALLWAFLFSLEGCGDDPNPCKGLSETSADFTIMEDFSYLPEYESNWPYYACDTVATKFVRFTAKDSIADSYLWSIGAGRYTTRTVTLNFSNSFETIVPVTLVVKKKPNVSCFPKDDGIDTVKRRVYFIDPCKTQINGKFFGANEDEPNKKFTIEVTACKENLGFYVTNEALACSGQFYNDDIGNLIGYKALVLARDPKGNKFCKRTYYIVRAADKKGNFLIRYSYFSDTVQFKSSIKKNFIAIKLGQ